MYDGRIEQLDTPETIYRRPATAFVSEFVGVTKRMPVVLDGNRIRVFGRNLGIDNLAAAGSNGTSLEALIRPADLALSHDSVSYTHLRAHETRHDLVCRLLLEKKQQQ